MGIGQMANVKQQLENDRGLEQAALTILKPGIKTCLEVNDDASRELLLRGRTLETSVT